MAFRPTDGCGLNVTLLEAILKEVRSKYHAVSLAFLDLRKAFDTASRRASMAALKLKGVPPILLDYLTWTVSNARVVILFLVYKPGSIFSALLLERRVGAGLRGPCVMGGAGRGAR